jgi:hypothetical protein
MYNHSIVGMHKHHGLALHFYDMVTDADMHFIMHYYHTIRYGS